MQRILVAVHHALFDPKSPYAEKFSKSQKSRYMQKLTRFSKNFLSFFKWSEPLSTWFESLILSVNKVEIWIGNVIFRILDDRRKQITFSFAILKYAYTGKQESKMLQRFFYLSCQSLETMILVSDTLEKIS